jgi:alkylation response protein AidB-like acyl-CoA dehydrogenase
LDAPIAYTKQRKQFRRPVGDFQGVQFMLADMAMKVEAARLMVYSAVHLFGGAGYTVDFLVERMMRDAKIT